MSCCGKKRAEYQTTNQADRLYGPSRGVSSRELTSGDASPFRSVPVVTTYFEYTGNTGMTVQGPITRRRYRFSGPGARVEVDNRDASSVAGVPNLRRITRS